MDNSKQTIQISDSTRIGTNYDYQFYVGKVCERWIGFARPNVKDPTGIFVFSQVSEGVYLGLTDRNEAIKRTAAFAESDEYGYGGITEWLLDESLRGKPEDYECSLCQTIFCEGECLDDEDWYDQAYPEDINLY